MTPARHKRWMDAVEPPPPLLAPETTVAQAQAALARAAPFGAVFLRGEDGEIGLMTRAQIQLAMRQGLAEARAADLMEGSDSAIPAGALLSLAALAFARSGSAWLPVVGGDGGFAGVVASDRILAALARSRRGRPPATRSVSLEGLSKRAIEVLALVGQEARRAEARGYLVGGAVRDLLLGRTLQMPDVDVAIEGDAPAVARAIARRAGGRATVHGRFGTATIVLEDGLELNLARTRVETYAYPGALPRVTAAPLARDLARRDFTVNAMAVALAPRAFARLDDPFGGEEDMEARCLRVLHPLSFVEDPTRILRAARFSARLGFAPTPQAVRLMRSALRLSSLSRVSGDRILAELDRAFGEPDPAEVVGRLARWGVFAALDPPLDLDDGTIEDMRSLDEALCRMAVLTRDLGIDRTRTFLVLLAGGLAPGARPRWLARLGLAGSALDAVEGACDRIPTVMAALAGNGPLAPSGLRRLLDPLSPEALAVCLAMAREAGPREAIERYLSTLRVVHPAIKGRDLKALGYPPGPAYGEMLDALLEARLDGLVSTREEEVCLLEKRFGKPGDGAGTE